MRTSILDLAPFIPADTALAQSPLPDKAPRLVHLSARLTGQLAPLTLATLERLIGLNGFTPSWMAMGAWDDC